MSCVDIYRMVWNEMGMAGLAGVQNIQSPIVRDNDFPIESDPGDLGDRQQDAPTPDPPGIPAIWHFAHTDFLAPAPYLSTPA